MAIGSEGQSRPIPRMHADSAAPDVAHVVSKLCDILGVKLVAYIGHESGTRAVRGGPRGSGPPATALRSGCRSPTAWPVCCTSVRGKRQFSHGSRGLNPQLDDNASARALRDSPFETATREVVAAARAFSAVG